MLRKTLSYVPTHHTYCEPFVGGGAMFYSKRRSSVEVINDLDANIFNFHLCLRDNFDKFFEKINKTLHSRYDWNKAIQILEDAKEYDALEVGWAVDTAYKYSWGNKGETFGKYCGSTLVKLNRRRRARNNLYKKAHKRIRDVIIENKDANACISKYDGKETFYYVDPPYFNSTEKKYHVGEYTQAHFEQLLTTLSKTKGLFMLCSYPSEILNDYARRNKWISRNFVCDIICSHMYENRKKTKIEVVTTNYESILPLFR